MYFILNKAQLIGTMETYMNAQRIEMRVVNGPTILIRVIQTVKKENLEIYGFTAEEPDRKDTSVIKMVIKADENKATKLVEQLERIADVIEVNAS